ncbi:cenp-o kinetochore centromere component [Pyrenophora seminiperda CCB06]|uniref:Cenp-o kinetochore centromere component n=1 Tax=Pyrenophora seminiperda CCB06 TaxID=1302712 RepID=A0A3M7MEL9_9PLEO|nr:cenp-o kinetochore centromere component [Pyrenophora seminiperda CCB06]
MEPTSQLDEDIRHLHTHISLLQAHRANLSSVLLSQPHLSARLQPSNHQRDTQQHAENTTARIIAQQNARNLENVYRTCAGVTAFRVKDPDPNAINNGNLLGISIDVAIGPKFVETYHVLLSLREGRNDKKKMLSIHKHTIPPCIPLQQLARRWIPGSTKDEEVDPEQDLVRFGRLLRKELVGWHMRVNAGEELRKSAGLEEPKEADGGEDLGTASSGKVLNAFVSDDEASSDIEHENDDDDDDGVLRLLDIETDAAVREMTITLSDRRTVVMSITKDGRIDKAVCRTKDGRRDVILSKTVMGPLRGLLRRLSV